MTADISLLADFSAYCSAFWRVSSKGGRPVPFRLNPAQRIVMHEVRKMEAAGIPVRMLILKARQQGISTFLTALFQHAAMTRPGFNGISIADKLELPRLWLRRAQRWYNETPRAIQPELAHSNAIELVFDDINSRYSISSERGTTPGMGMSLQGVHCSEISNWHNFEKVMSDLLPAVPQVAGTMVILESTGEMEGDDWHKQVVAAQSGDNEYKLVFLPWWLSPEYSKKTSDRMFCITPEEIDIVRVAEQWAQDNPEHAEIAGFTRLSHDQLTWRRWVIKNEFFGDVERFKSRYPSTVAEAFIGVGNLALPANMVRYHASTCIEPLTYLRLTGTPDAMKAEVGAEADEFSWRVYENKQDACEYTIGADSSSGRPSDPQNERSERDRAAMVVLNRRSLTTVAVLRGEIEPDQLGAQLLLAAKYWNDAWIAPEVNNTGYALVAAVRKYPRIIPREGLPDMALDRPLHRLGFQTDGPSRNLLISDWEKWGREEPNTHYDGKLRCLSRLIADEERTFVIKKSGKREHRAGCHDDVLIASMLALQAHLVCPHEHMGLFERKSIPEDEKAQMCVTLPSHAFTGGVDNFDPGAEDDD